MNLAFFTQAPKPVGEVGGGMANSILGSGNSVGCRQLDWRTDWNIRRDFSGGVWTRRKTGEHSSLYGGCVERRAIDRDGNCGVLADCFTAKTFLGSLGRRGFGHHDDSDDHAHDGRDAADGSERDQGSGAWTGRAELAVGAIDNV